MAKDTNYGCILKLDGGTFIDLTSFLDIFLNNFLMVFVIDP
jgi:hypothetical protein